MNQSEQLTEIARLIGQAAAAGAMEGPASSLFGPLLAQPGLAEAVVPSLFAAARGAEPDITTLDGYAFMLRSALEEMRVSANGGDLEARREIDRVRAAVATASSDASVSGGVLVQVGRCFAQAQLDPGPALQAAVAARLDALDAEKATDPSGTGSDLFADLAEELGHDPFAMHVDLAATAAAFPIKHRARVVGGFTASPHRAMREAALGFALDAEPEVAEALVRALQATPAADLSAETTDRLARIRTWLPATRRERIDALLAGCARPAAPPQRQKAQVRGGVATLCDGAGAQSVALAVKQGRKHAFVSILLKAGRGVVDTAIHQELGKRDIDELMQQLRFGAGALKVSTGYVERRLAAALGVNVAIAAPPPFGLVQAAEIAGFGPIESRAIGPAAVAATLLESLPSARTEAAASREAHLASAGWERRFDCVSSWFEAGEEVERLLASRKSKARRVAAIVDDLLPARRQFWAEQCAWAAATIKETRDPAWIEFALVARDLAGAVPLDQIPLGRDIARRTVEAFG